MYTPPFCTYGVLIKLLASSFCEYKWLGTESRIWGKVGLEVVKQLYVLIWFSFLQWPQLPLTSEQSRKVALVSESVGPHPLHRGIQLGTGSTIVVAAMAVWMLVMASQTTTY